MANIFREFSAHKKKSYGGYCSNVRQSGITPCVYQEFANLMDSGLTCKQIIKLHKEMAEHVKSDNDLDVDASKRRCFK